MAAASTVLGAGLHVSGSVLLVVGQTVLKVATLINETSSCKDTWTVSDANGSQPPQWRSPDGLWRKQWLGSKGCKAVGWTGFVFGNLLRFAAMRFGAQAVLSALTSVQFVVIPIASFFFLGEHVTFATLASIAVVMLEVKFTLDQLRGQWNTTRMHIFLAVLLCLLAALHVGVLYVKKLEKKRNASPRARWRARMKPGHDDLTFAHAMLFSAFSALIGANSVLFSKSLTYVITAPWPSQLSDWYSWAVLFAFIATGGFWVRQTAVALAKFPAGLVMSVMQAFWMCQSIIAGGIYFKEFWELHGWPAVYFTVGLVAAIAGALCMGCASFMAEQHVMVSYTMLPGYGQDLIPDVADQERMRMYGLRFAGLGTGGGAAGELELVQDISPRTPGSELDAEKGRRLQQSASSFGATHSSATSLPHAGSSDWKENMQVLADRAAEMRKQRPSQDPYGFYDDSCSTPPATVHVVASAQLSSLQGLPPAALSAAAPVLRSGFGAAAPGATTTSAAPASAHAGVARQGPGTWQTVTQQTAAAANGQAADRQRGLSGLPALHRLTPDDVAILGHHAAAINASLTAAGSRLVASTGSGGFAGGISKEAPSQIGSRVLSDADETASMHSANSNLQFSSSAALTPWQQGSLLQQQSALLGGLDADRARTLQSIDDSLMEESLLNEHGMDSTGRLRGEQVHLGRAPTSTLDRSWQMLRHPFGSH